MKLEVKDASIGYKKQVLSSNINMASEPGMVTAILGQNGCGKTTFVKSLMKECLNFLNTRMINLVQDSSSL